MPAYATKDDVIARYEQEVVDRICWDKTSDSADYDRLDRALEDASAETDSYVSTRFPVPVNPTPLILRNINIDLGLYSCALTADKLFAELERRADNWRKHLVLIARGQAGLGVREDQSPTDLAPAEGTSVGTGMIVKSVRI
jgi:phage gp36-like protein